MRYLVSLVAVMLVALLVGTTFAQNSRHGVDLYVNQLASEMNLIQVECSSVISGIFSGERYQPNCFIPLRNFDARLIARSFDLHFDWERRTGFEAKAVTPWSYEDGMFSRSFAVRTSPPAALAILIDEYVQDIVIWQIDNDDAWIMFE